MQPMPQFISQGAWGLLVQREENMAGAVEEMSAGALQPFLIGALWEQELVLERLQRCAGRCLNST